MTAPDAVGCAEGKAQSGYTTVMLRNIPNKYTQQMLIDQLHQMGYRGAIDYLYLPIDFSNRCNCGYCFINFRSGAARQHFVDRFDGQPVQTCLPGFNSYKVCQVTRAKWQGRDENVKRLKSGPELMGMLVAHPEWLPLVFDEDGNQEALSVDGVQATPSLPYRKGGRKGQNIPPTKRGSGAIHFHEALWLSSTMDDARSQGRQTRTRRGGGGVRSGNPARSGFCRNNFNNSGNNNINSINTSNGNNMNNINSNNPTLPGSFGEHFREANQFPGMDEFVLARALQLANLEFEHQVSAVAAGGSYEPFEWYMALDANVWPTTDSPTEDQSPPSVFRQAPSPLLIDSPRRVEIGPAFA
mmetsp:Transcript_91998/g.201626  ORF Transcript_91998/g.201626 Transcript_91998/m.201626 type:complete len:355 (+) Transcript_91998:102-1166(+)